MKMKSRNAFLLLPYLLTNIEASDSSSTNVRGPTKQRISPYQRIYGTENAAVHAERHRIETESTHYLRTGLHSDLDFYLDQYDPVMRKRRLQGNVIEKFDGTFFEPLRITMVTDHLDSRRSVATEDQVDFIVNTILPRMSKFWSETLNVLPVGTREGVKNMPLKIDNSKLIQQKYCGDMEFTAVPTEHIVDGVENTDLILYVSGEPSARFCGPSTLAVAVACNFDEQDRPTAGAINFCLDQIELDRNGGAHESVIQDNVDVAIHEAAHVLGMSSNSYKFFRDENGEALTPRVNGGFQKTLAECVNGETKQEVIPAETTLKLLTADNGQRYATIVTPKVQAVVRNHFNCMDLDGAQLENQPTGNSCTGDHWDERLFYPESLSGVISPTSVILSPLTLALFEDSGWYSANYTKSQLSPWGHGAGCDFVNEPCLIQSTPKPTVPDYGRGYFCSDSSQRGCSPSQYYKMGCTVLDYSLYSEKMWLPPPRFQYFADEHMGGLSQADYCPVYGSGYRANIHDLDCRGSSSELINFYGEEYGAESMCFESTSGTGRCYKHKCSLETRKLYIYVNFGWQQCTEDFAEIKIDKDWADASIQSTVTCPRLTSACPDMFCPVNCAGRGICNWDFIDENGTASPKCECFNKTDTSAACTESLPLGNKYIVDSSGLVNTLRKKFFDPLISIFTDNPDEWETESWIWASALIFIFLLLMLCICSTFWPKKKNDRRDYKRGNMSHDYRGSPSRSRAPPRRQQHYYDHERPQGRRGERPSSPRNGGYY